jgi:hypothetical protein
MKKPGEHGREAATIALYCDGERPKTEQRSFVCFGAVRGGTSMVAGVMQAAGVHMGFDLGDTHEDPVFAKRGVNVMVAEVERRKTLGLSHWGWKFPNAPAYLDQLRPHLPDPHLVVVTRDTVATAMGHLRWHGREQLAALSDVMVSTQRNLLMALTWQVPALLVSYEKAVANPLNFITEFCEFAQLPVPANLAEIVLFMEPGSYKNAPAPQGRS